MTKKTLFMETTEVPAERTAAEICTLLVQSGARQINTEYEGGKIVGLRWTMRVYDQDLLFTMPARIEPVYAVLLKRAKQSSRWYGYSDQIEKLRATAERVGWRQLLRWIQAQVAMIETGMVEATEVFFPYLYDPRTDQTLFQHHKETRLKALPPAPEGAAQ